MSLNRLTFSELSQKVWDDSIKHQEILDEAGLRFKNGEIKDWQLRNLMATMRDKDTLDFPIKLKKDHNSQKMREYLFIQLTNRLGVGGAFYWSGSPESYNRDFISLVQDITKIDLKDMSQYTHIQDRAISSLAKLYFSNDLAANRVKDIAQSYLDLPDPNKKAEEKVITKHGLKMFDADHTSAQSKSNKNLDNVQKDQQFRLK